MISTFKTKVLSDLISESHHYCKWQNFCFTNSCLAKLTKYFQIRQFFQNNRTHRRQVVSTTPNMPTSHLTLFSKCPLQWCLGNTCQKKPNLSLWSSRGPWWDLSLTRWRSGGWAKKSTKCCIMSHRAFHLSASSEDLKSLFQLSASRSIGLR